MASMVCLPQILITVITIVLTMKPDLPAEPTFLRPSISDGQPCWAMPAEAPRVASKSKLRHGFSNQIKIESDRTTLQI